MYLKNRDPFPLNLTPYLGWKDHENPAKNEQVVGARSAPSLFRTAARALPCPSCTRVSSGARLRAPPPPLAQASRSADFIVAAVRFQRSLAAQALNPDIWRMKVDQDVA
jgi:hypothetical protein